MLRREKEHAVPCSVYAAVAVKRTACTSVGKLANVALFGAHLAWQKALKTLVWVSTTQCSADDKGKVRYVALQVFARDQRTGILRSYALLDHDCLPCLSINDCHSGGCGGKLA